jgi:hypothetical protein
LEKLFLLFFWCWALSKWLGKCSKDNFAGYSILGWQFFWGALSVSYHSLLDCKVFAEKSAVSVMRILFYMI